MSWGHNIVADGWAGASNSHPHPHALLPKHTHSQKASKTLVPLFDLFPRINGQTDGRTDGWTDGWRDEWTEASYRVACLQLNMKMKKKGISTEVQKKASDILS